MNDQTNTLTLLQPEIQKATDASNELLAAASQQITTAAHYSAGADFLKRIKSHMKELDEREKAITRPINESLKAIRDLFRNPKDLLDRAESALKSNLLSFQRAEEARRQAAQAAAEQAARQERERLERAAARAEAAGKIEQAEARREVAAAVVAPIVVSEQPKVAGIATRKDWDFEIVDPLLLPAVYLQPDLVKIRKAVRALGKDANIPGVRVIEREIMAVSA